MQTRSINIALLNAVKAGNLAEVENCLAEGAEVDALTEKQETPLAWALYRGGQNQKDSSTNQKIETYLGIAIRLMEYGANVNHPSVSSEITRFNSPTFLISLITRLSSVIEMRASLLPGIAFNMCEFIISCYEQRPNLSNSEAELAKWMDKAAMLDHPTKTARSTLFASTNLTKEEVDSISQEVLPYLKEDKNDKETDEDLATICMRKMRRAPRLIHSHEIKTCLAQLSTDSAIIKRLAGLAAEYHEDIEKKSSPNFAYNAAILLAHYYRSVGAIQTSLDYFSLANQHAQKNPQSTCSVFSLLVSKLASDPSTENEDIRFLLLLLKKDGNILQQDSYKQLLAFSPNHPLVTALCHVDLLSKEDIASSFHLNILLGRYFLYQPSHDIEHATPFFLKAKTLAEQHQLELDPGLKAFFQALTVPDKSKWPALLHELPPLECMQSTLSWKGYVDAAEAGSLEAECYLRKKLQHTNSPIAIAPLAGYPIVAKMLQCPESVMLGCRKLFIENDVDGAIAEFEKNQSVNLLILSHYYAALKNYSEQKPQHLDRLISLYASCQKNLPKTAVFYLELYLKIIPLATPIQQVKLLRLMSELTFRKEDVASCQLEIETLAGNNRLLQHYAINVLKKYGITTPLNSPLSDEEASFLLTLGEDKPSDLTVVEKQLVPLLKNPAFAATMERMLEAAYPDGVSSSEEKEQTTAYPITPEMAIECCFTFAKSALNDDKAPLTQVIYWITQAEKRIAVLQHAEEPKERTQFLADFHRWLDCNNTLSHQAISESHGELSFIRAIKNHVQLANAFAKLESKPILSLGHPADVFYNLMSKYPLSEAERHLLWGVISSQNETRCLTTEEKIKPILDKLSPDFRKICSQLLMDKHPDYLEILHSITLQPLVILTYYYLMLQASPQDKAAYCEKAMQACRDLPKDQPINMELYFRLILLAPTEQQKFTLLALLLRFNLENVQSDIQRYQSILENASSNYPSLTYLAARLLHQYHLIDQEEVIDQAKLSFTALSTHSLSMTNPKEKIEQLMKLAVLFSDHMETLNLAIEAYQKAVTISLAQNSSVSGVYHALSQLQNKTIPGTVLRHQCTEAIRFAREARTLSDGETGSVLFLARRNVLSAVRMLIREHTQKHLFSGHPNVRRALYAYTKFLLLTIDLKRASAESGISVDSIRNIRKEAIQFMTDLAKRDSYRELAIWYKNFIDRIEGTGTKENVFDPDALLLGEANKADSPIKDAVIKGTQTALGVKQAWLDEKIRFEITIAHLAASAAEVIKPTSMPSAPSFSQVSMYPELPRYQTSTLFDEAKAEKQSKMNTIKITPSSPISSAPLSFVENDNMQPGDTSPILHEAEKTPTTLPLTNSLVEKTLSVQPQTPAVLQQIRLFPPRSISESREKRSH